MRDPLDVDQVCSLPYGEVRYGVRGAGPPVLLVMGFMARGRAWRSQIEALSDQYTVVWFDHRGVGDSPGPAAKSMQSFAEDCVHLMNHLQWGSAHVVGISMGGMIAQELAVTHPDRIQSLSLIVTHFGGWHRVIPTFKGVPLFLKAQFARTPLGRLRALKSLLVPQSIQQNLDDEMILEKLKEDFTPKPPLQTRISHFKAILGHQTRVKLRQFLRPTLVIQAQEDLLVHPKHSLTLSTVIPNCRFVSFAQAGHGIVRQSNIALSDELLKHFLEVERA